MQTIRHSLGAAGIEIHVPERPEDMGAFRRFLGRGDKVLGLDTETSSLDVYAPGHTLRLVQLGNEQEAWVLRADTFADDIRAALRQPRAFVAHNLSFDALVIDRHLGVKVEELTPRCFDTRILAHLLDPRLQMEGGVGLRLKELAKVYVDPSAPDTEEGLTAEFRCLGFTKATGWAGIPIDNELYLRYAGLDPILAIRLFRELAPIVKGAGLNHLSQFEHHLALLLMILQRRGLLLDVPYVEKLREELLADAERFGRRAEEYGVVNPNSTAQVSAALLAMGETLTETTPSGALKVDKAVLMNLADLDAEWEPNGNREPNPLAAAILRSKRAAKWAEAYAGAFLDLRDLNDRLHPSIGGLQARTARMSISRPPLQQLPSSDWRIRRGIIADPGHVIIAADYKQVEMRVLAALSEDKNMREAIASGVDLHDWTATIIYGPGFTKFQRKLIKGVGFGKVYGGGAATLSRQTGAPIEQVREAIAAYDKTFPGIKRYGRRLQERAQFGKREVVTPSGRHLPLDRDRLYSATNYVVQSTARDLLAQALVDLFDKGLGDHLLLPVHDEIVAQAPAADAAEVVAEIGRVMESTFYGVHIASDTAVYGPSWGHGYGAPM